MPAPDRFTRVVTDWLRRILPASDADPIVGDLVEHASRRRTGRRLWLAAEAIRLAWGFRHGDAPADPRPARRVLLEIWLRDVRYALRSLARSRGFTAIALTSLALGVGLTTAVFSVVDGLLLRPLPYGEAERIVRVREITAGVRPGGDQAPRGLVREWQTTSRVLSAFAPYSRLDARVATDGDTWVGVRVDVGERFFDVLRTHPVHGRLLGRTDADKAAPMVAVLSNAFWRNAFGARADVVGRRILVDDKPVTVVGVLPDDFGFPSADAVVYLPGRYLLPDFDPGRAQAFLAPPLELAARLRPGATPDDALQEARSIGTRLPGAGVGESTTLEVVRLQDDLVRDVRPALVMLLAAVGCVLTIVCVNLTNLLLARGTVRQREMAVRAALGASRWGMARPLVLEGVLLAGAGGAAGLLLAGGLLASMPLSASIDPMLAAQIRIDGRVVGFTLALTGLVGAIVGMLPAWQTPAGDIKGAVSGGQVQVLPGAALGAERVRAALVVVQVALAVMLAVGATLLSRSLVTLVTVDLGFEPEGALAAEVRLPPGGGSTWDWRARFYQDFLERLEAHGAVRAAGFTTSLPMQETFALAAIRIEGLPPPPGGGPLRAHREAVTPGYFAAIGLPVRRGRGFEPADTDRAERVAIVNEAFAVSIFGGADPIGQRVMIFGDWARIVGVVASKRHSGLRSSARAELYVPLAQSPPDVVTQSSAGVVLRAAGNPVDLVPFVRSTLRALQPQAGLENEAALADRVWASTAAPRFYATVMGGFAALALVTALVGLYGVLSYVVERRRVEIGVRRALGASGRDISGLVLGRGFRLVAFALPVGLAGAAAGVGLLRSLLFGIEPADPATFVVVAVGVPAVALAACLLPARRAVGIEPIDALRDE